MTSLIFEGSKSSRALKLEQTLIASFSLGERATTQEIAARAVALATLFAPDISDADLKRVIAKVETLVLIQMEDVEPVVDPESFEGWLTAERISSISWDRWDAYSALLRSKGYPPVVLDRMGKRGETILEMAGDPKRTGAWARRGLVIGEVQSGKTANYLALFNKAADAGYKIIILFGGHTDKLRRQTQERVDEGFVGRDSRKLKHRPGVLVKATMGVGLHPQFVPATSLTTWMSDFSARQQAGMNLTASAINGPVIFVIKKNKKIIENLIAWLHSQGDGSDAVKLDLPMLLLDDESDYASINTNNPDDNPTAINGAIRELLDVFSRNSYLGFTATPFANVFIDPDHEEDLFPKDYIFPLESPSNYFGPEAMFADETAEQNFMTPNDDADLWLPYAHKSGHIVGELPDSLLDSVAAFFIVNAIRDIRGAQVAPRTMMVNVSRFNRVQAAVAEKIENVVAEWRQQIYSGVGAELAARLIRVYQQQFTHQEVPWEEIQMALRAAVQHVQVKVVNSKTNATDDWSEVYESDRARVIAVGGDVLSRGLTLEGLAVSYFRRKSVAYDTLMQMGRWFGYREGYRDICKLWIDPIVASWYDFIAQATEELRDQVGRMRQQKQTPQQFGLAVRRHPGAALVATALKKMQHTRTASQISLRDKSFETVRFADDRQINQSNFEAAKAFLDSLKVLGAPQKCLRSKNPIWAAVPASHVLKFVRDFRTASNDLVFADGVIRDHLENTKAEWMKTWDVVFVSGNSELDAFPGLNGVKKVNRAIYLREGVLYSGGTKLRLGGRSDEGQILDDTQFREAQNAANGKEPGDRHFRAQLVKPLLLVYSIDPSVDNGAVNVTQRDAGYNRFLPGEESYPLVGLHIAFPIGDSSIDPDAASELVSWTVGKIWLQQNSLVMEDEE
jgi:hypothetical protein